MNGRERVSTLLQGGTPDRVPITLHNFQMATERSGRPYDVVLRSGELLAEAMLAEWNEFHHDILLVEIGTACSAEALGAPVDYDEERSPIAHRPTILSLDDIDQLEIPPIESAPSWKVTLDAVRILRRELGDEVAICGRADQGPFSLAAILRGMEDFLLDVGMGEDDEAIHNLMAFCEEVVFRYAKALKEAGADTTSIGDSFAGPDLINPNDYRRLAWPHEKRVIERIQQELDLPVHLHICGHADPILEDMVNTTAEVLEIDQKASMTAAKKAASGHCVLHGNIDPERCMFATPDEVSDLVKRVIDEGAEHGGLMIGPGCALGGSTPAENIRALCDTAREYGVY